LYTNADQFLNKLDDLNTLISGNPPDIIIINEVLPKNKSTLLSKSMLNIPGYTLYTNFDDHYSSKSLRGMCMYFSTFLNVQEVFFSGPLSIEHLWIKVKVVNQDHLLLGCVYRSPSSCKLSSTIDLCNLLQTVVGSKPSHLLIVGDFNYSEINWCSSTISGNDQNAALFLDTVLDCFLFQHAVSLTQFRSGCQPHVLDLIFTNEENMIHDLSYLPPLGKSDHVVLSFEYCCYSMGLSQEVKYSYS